jgi:hypothetical protein
MFRPYTYPIAFSITIVCLYAILNPRQEGMHVGAKHLSPVPVVIATGAGRPKAYLGSVARPSAGAKAKNIPGTIM